jgi:acyl-coenzyme A thioesterase PaaI-like protein
MKYKVVNKQYTSKHCFVCGEENKGGLHARFYEMENGEIAGIFTSPFEHSGYPGRIHGGVASAIIDEAIGRAIMITEPDTFAVTLELSTKFRKPVPVCTELKVIARITSKKDKIFEGTGEILLENGDVAVTGSAKYLKLPIERIAGKNLEAGDLLYNSDGITEIDF